MNLVDLDFDELEQLLYNEERFETSLTREELDKRIENTQSKNSKKKAEWAVKIFKDWLSRRQSNGIINGYHVFKEFEEMTKGELDSQLQYFAFEVRNKKGGRYPATSLRDIFQGIGYHLKVVLRRGWRIFNDSEFSLSRTSLDAAMKEANSLGVRSQGSGPSDAVSKLQEEYLWDREALDDTSPEVLLRTIFFCCGKFFGLRGGREHRDLEFGKHIKLSQTERGETLVYSNSYSKNFTGGLKQSSLKPKTVKIVPCIENPK